MESDTDEIIAKQRRMRKMRVSVHEILQRSEYGKIFVLSSVSAIFIHYKQLVMWTRLEAVQSFFLESHAYYFWK